MRKAGLLCLFFILLPTVLSAQQVRTAIGRTFALFDESKEILPDANIAVFEASDSILVKATTSGSDGKFSISYNVAQGKSYLLKISFIGMEPEFIALEGDRESIDLGDIVLKEGMELPEFVVTAPMKEVVQVGDTTIINAEAFQTPEGSFLEELVKRIPGLEYDAQSASLVYNGLPISSINVNGEEFFSGNNRMALENLPVELISKIKVYDKRSELEKVTGVRSGGENYVLDIQTKAEFSGALLASGKVARGNNDKKELEFIGNYFKMNGDNVSLILNSGNRQMSTRYKDNMQHSGGLNVMANVGEKLSLNGNVSLMNNHNGSETTSYTEQYLTSGNRFQLSSGENVSKSRGITSFGGLRWQIDEKTFLNIFGNANITRGESESSNRQAMFDTDPGADLSDPFAEVENIPREAKINDVRMSSIASNEMNSYSFNANLTRKINTKGSSVSLVLQRSQNSGDNKSFSNSSTVYYRLPDSDGNDSTLNRVQSQLSPNSSRGHGVGVMFTHPFSSKLNMQVAYNLSSNKQRSDRNTYDLSPFLDEETESIQPDHLPPGYESGYIDSLSNRSSSHTLTHELSLRADYSSEVWDVNASLSVSPEKRSLDQKTGLLQADTAMRSVGFRPELMASWKKDKLTLRLNYQGNTQQPSLSDLLSLTDNSDPLNITRGNPNLKPAYDQSLRLEINDSRHDISASVNFRNTINSTTRAVIYNLETGGRESYPVNINGNWGSNAMLRYQKRIRVLRIAALAGSTYNRNVSLVNEGQSEQPERSVTSSKGLNGNLRLSYLPQWGSFELVGDWRFQYSHNSLRRTDNYTRNYTLSLNNFANLPGNFQLRSDASYILRNGTSIEKGDDQFVWNAGIAWKFMKKKQGELSAYWSDLLSRKKNYSRNVTADGFYESRTQQIGSYFIVSFRYSFNHPLQK